MPRWRTNKLTGSASLGNSCAVTKATALNRPAFFRKCPPCLFSPIAANPYPDVYTLHPPVQAGECVPPVAYSLSVNRGLLHRDDVNSLFHCFGSMLSGCFTANALRTRSSCSSEARM